MAAIYYDTEFLERGAAHPIGLISIGLVAENGDELYRIIRDEALVTAAREHPWLREHVTPHLPIRTATEDLDAEPGELDWEWDPEHPDFGALRTREDCAGEVLDFIRAHAPEDPELWAWYADYDHVVLCQLCGTMADLPDGIPMWTHDLRHEFGWCGQTEAPSMPGRAEHRSLDDAREVKWRREWLAANYDPGPRWPSMRLVRDVDDFAVLLDEDGEMHLSCPSDECWGYALEGYALLSDVLSHAYRHIREHEAAGR
jgi:hypothetical protein